MVKFRFILILSTLLLILSGCGKSESAFMKIEKQLKRGTEVEAACGQCMFDMEGYGCDLAIRVGENTFFVEGTHIDAHGDAHSDAGFCNAISKAKVKGKIEDGKFIASSFELVN